LTTAFPTMPASKCPGGRHANWNELPRGRVLITMSEGVTADGNRCCGSADVQYFIFISF
jgi:hypothetical protein